MLLFLLCTSVSPTKASYSPPPSPLLLRLPTRTDNFDWAAYLMEGIEIPEYSDSDSEFSDLSDDDPRPSTWVGQKGDQNDSAVELVDETLDSSLSHCNSARQWLVDHLVSPYWDSNLPASYYSTQQDPSLMEHPSCNLATNWFSYSSQRSPFPVEHSSTAVTEAQVVRETLWVLLGAEAGFIYMLTKGGSVQVRPQIHVSHLTPESLHVQLQYFASVASKLHSLRQFVSVTGNSLSEPACFDTSQTLQAFANGLTCYLQYYNAELEKVENDFVKESRFVSILDLANVLHSKEAELSCLHAVILGMNTVEHCTERERACSLMDSLWTALDRHDTMGTAGLGVVRVLCPLFVMTVRAYLEVADLWMTEGNLRDVYHEFFVERNNQISLESKNFWQESYHLHNPLPVWMKAMANKIYVAGKSMMLIEAVGKLSHSQFPPSPGKKAWLEREYFSRDLYSEFVRTLKEGLVGETRSKQQSDSPYPLPSAATGLLDVAVRNEEDFTLTALSATTVTSATADLEREQEAPSLEYGALVLWNTDPLLRQFLHSMSVGEDHQQEPSKTGPCRSVWQELTAIIADNIDCPLTLRVQGCLRPIVEQKFLHASSALTNLLMSEFRLLNHFRDARLLLLMEAGDVVHHFVTELFPRILAGETWKEPSFLNSLLLESIQDRYPHLEKSLSVVVAPTELRVISIHSPTCLFLHYKVPWPLDVIFSKQLMDIYNAVFQFLLQVKWAKWCLDEIRIGQYRGYCGKDATKLHKLFLLRAKLLHFVNVVSHYLLTRILHSSGLEFQEQIMKAGDLDSIILLHKDYITKVFDRCLLNVKAIYVKEMLMKVLMLALDFQQKWSLGVANFKWSDGERMEAEFTRCVHFLVSCLNNFITRGSFPHLETLATSLSSVQTERIFSSN